MAQDNAPNKPVHLIYLCGAVLLFYLLQWSIDWIWGYFGTAPSESKISMMAAVGAVVAGVWLYRNDRVYHLANEVSSELKKVTWPSKNEVYSTTIVVILTTVFFGFYLYGLDILLSQLFTKVLGSR